jgi:hypothetical protein
MNQEWGRNQYAGEWQHPKPWWTIAALVLAVVSVGGICAYRHAYVLTPLQRFYFWTYIRSELRTGIGFKTGRYTVLNVADRKGSRLALDEEVMPVTTPSGETTFALTEVAVRAGDQRLVLQQGQYDNARLNAFLAHWIYRDQTYGDLFEPALCGDVRYWIENNTYPPDEIAVRFHHRLTLIHPFPNGNGRHARLIADILLIRLGRPAFTWGSANLVKEGEARTKYLEAIRLADNGNVQSLLKFARS